MSETFELKVEGKGPITKKELRIAIPYMMKLMNAHRILNNADICVVFDRGADVEGYCLMPSRKTFDIGINPEISITRERAISTLAHELVHLKQFARKELSYDGPYFKYDGKTFDLDGLSYLLAPWEVEAYGKEQGLSLNYLDYARSLPKSIVAKRAR